jgi:hypothetical protein
MGLFSWYADRVRATQQLPLREYLIFFTCKVLGGLAVGLLLASYVAQVDWIAVGWTALAASVLISLPLLPRILR